MLLPALYIALMAGEFEELGQAGERAVAWALELAENAVLVPVTDVLLTRHSAARSRTTETCSYLPPRSAGTRRTASPLA